jgi:NAD+ synthase
MPIHQHTDHTNRGKEHIKWLKSKYNNIIELTFDLTATYETFKSTLNPYVTDLSLANARARLRMTTLYNIAQMQDGLVVGTGNKVEDFGVGFYTKYGDGGVDISPIGDLLKSEVYEIGRELGIIDSIMKAPPTDGLFGDSRTDEEQLGATYDELEWAMNYQENTNLSDRDLEVLKIYRNLNKKNKHKMNPIPVCLKPKN